MLIAATVALIVTLILILLRALLGPSLYDRILAVNLFGNSAVLLIAIHTFVSGRTELLDIALAYAMVNFISIFALLRFITFSARRSVGTP